MTSLFVRSFCQSYSRTALVLPEKSAKNWNNVRWFKYSRQSSQPKQRIQLVPLEEAADATLGSRNLGKSFLFAVGSSCCCFLGAIIWQYENMRKEATSYMESRHLRILGGGAAPKYGHFRQQLNIWWNSQSEGVKLAWGITAANILVFLLWKIPGTQPVMVRYFCSNPASKSVCLPMFLSTFSHYSFFHLCANMFVLHSFSTGAVNLLGREQFLATYFSAGLLSSFVSYLHKGLTGRMSLSLGASGAIMAVISMMCVQYPDAKLAIIFLPFFTFSAGSAIKAVIALDTAGLVLGWKIFDHAAHLGGALFGIGYLTYGRELWSRREPVMQYWHNIREGFK